MPKIAMKGFMAFVLGAILLIAFALAAARLSWSKPDYSYKRIVAFGLQETALKQSFYSALSGAAQAAAAAQGDGISGPVPVQLAAHARALLFEQELRSAGFDAVFWCGSPTESERAAASEAMAHSGRAAAPAGSTQLSPLTCQDSFIADLKSGRLHISNLGFSLYSKELGIGRAAAFPSSYEVDFIAQ